MKIVTCANLACGVPFEVPDHVFDQAQRNHQRVIYCPNGHQTVFTASEPQRLRERIESPGTPTERLSGLCRAPIANGALLAWDRPSEAQGVEITDSDRIAALERELAQVRELERSHRDQLALYRDLFARIRNLAAAGEGAETVLSLPETLPGARLPPDAASGLTGRKLPATRKPSGSKRTRA